MLSPRARGIFVGTLMDRIIGDPSKHHPVAYFGNYVSWLEKQTYADDKAAGTRFLLAAVVPPTLMAMAVAKRWPAATLSLTLWAALGGTTLEKTGERIAGDLEKGDEEAAREWIPWLCSRDPQLLDEAGMARAAVESIAENTSDATIAPLFWAAVGGAPMVVLHRCVNTLDAMVGYKNEKYSEFGWASAKFDDVLAYLPARLTAAVHTAIATTNGRGEATVRAWKNDAPKHPSPNAGPVEATAAAALGVRLGGPTTYSYGTENRPALGAGPAPDTQTIRQAVSLSRNTQLAVATLAVVACSAFAFRR